MKITSRPPFRKRKWNQLSQLGRTHRHPYNIQEWSEKNHAIYQNNEKTSFDKKEVEPVETVLKNIHQSNTYRKDLSWPRFNDEQRVKEKKQVKDQQSCIVVFVACLTIPSSNYGHQPICDNSIPYMDAWQIYRDTEQPQEKET